MVVVVYKVTSICMGQVYGSMSYIYTCNLQTNTLYIYRNIGYDFKVVVCKWLYRADVAYSTGYKIAGLGPEGRRISRLNVVHQNIHVFNRKISKHFVKPPTHPTFCFIGCIYIAFICIVEKWRGRAS